MTERRALVLTDGRAGNRAQALALADAMGLAVEEPALALPAPWRWFAPRSLPGAERRSIGHFPCRQSTELRSNPESDSQESDLPQGRALRNLLHRNRNDSNCNHDGILPTRPAAW